MGTNDDKDLWLHMVSPGHIELMPFELKVARNVNKNEWKINMK